MASDTWLCIFMLALFSYTAYGIFTNKVSPEDRDEMLDSEEMFP
jgi:hypothetical protein